MAEQLRFRLIGEAGCLACFLFAGRFAHCEVHHLTIGGKHGAKRRGHRFTIGLCGWHHRGELSQSAETLEALLGPSYARTPSKFRTVIGDDAALLLLQGHRLAQVAASYLCSPGEYA